MLKLHTELPHDVREMFTTPELSEGVEDLLDSLEVEVPSEAQVTQVVEVWQE